MQGGSWDTAPSPVYSLPRWGPSRSKFHIFALQKLLCVNPWKLIVNRIYLWFQKNIIQIIEYLKRLEKLVLLFHWLKREVTVSVYYSLFFSHKLKPSSTYKSQTLYTFISLHTGCWEGEGRLGQSLVLFTKNVWLSFQKHSRTAMFCSLVWGPITYPNKWKVPNASLDCIKELVHDSRCSCFPLPPGIQVRITWARTSSQPTMDM